MTATTLSSLVLILLVIVASPILSDLLSSWVTVPGVVLEIGLGVVIGPWLGIAHLDSTIEFLSQLGLASLMFLAGLEIDLPEVRGRPLRRAIAGWGISLVLGVAVGTALAPLDGARSGLIVGMAMTTTALGTLLPILADSGQLGTDFGTRVLAGAAVGELGPILAISVLLGSDRPWRTLVVLALFVVIVLAAAWWALHERSARLARLLDVTLFTSGQLAVRIVVMFLAFMVWVASELGLDVLLGAFAAGMVYRLFTSGADERLAELVEAKLHGLGFGFLVPVFFVVSGMQFDLDALTERPALLVAAVGFLVLFLAVRGVPTGLIERDLPTEQRVALGLYLSTQLPMVVVITSIGVRTGRLESGKAAALVAAAMLSVLLFPSLAQRVGERRRGAIPEAATA